MNRQRVLYGACFVLGVSSLVSQVVLAREFITSFYGNEFFIGWFLFSWLLWSGVGSLLGGKGFNDREVRGEDVARAQALAAVFLPLEIVAARASRLLMGQMPGAIPDLVPALIYSFLLLAPFCILLGLQFSLIVRALAEDPGRIQQEAGKAYFIEIGGFIFGGAAYSLLWVFWETFAVAALVMGFNLGAAVLILISLRKKRAFIAFVLSAIIVGFFARYSNALEFKTAELHFPSEKLKIFFHSLHGNIAVTQRGEQHHFYQNGVFLGTERESLASEYLVHFPMLAHPDPNKVLSLGTGFNGTLQEILKHDPTTVHEVELDPMLLGAAQMFLPPDLRSVLRDRRVQVWSADPRSFFKKYSGAVDVIIANFPDPSSVLINRNYTEEFFRLVEAHMRPGGIFAMRLGFAPDYVTPELQRLGGSVYATLKEVFPYVKVLPEDTIYYLATKEGAEATTLQKMIERMRERRITTSFLTEEVIRYRFANDRTGRVTSLFENMLWKTKNKDLRPRSYYFEFLRWLSQFHSRVARNLFHLTQFPYAVLLIAILGCMVAPFLILRDPEKRNRGLSINSMGIAGFSLMAFEVVLIYLFQVAFGNLYYRLGLLLTALMAGTGAGVWLAMRFKGISSPKMLGGIHLLAAAYFCAGVVFFSGSFGSGLAFQRSYQVIFAAAAALGGIFAGAGFPYATSFYVSEGKGRRAGAVYGADLLGASLGAFLTAGFLIPIWGVYQTLMLLAAINVLGALLFFLCKNMGRKDV